MALHLRIWVPQNLRIWVPSHVMAALCSLEIRRFAFAASLHGMAKGRDLLTMVHSLGVLPHADAARAAWPCQHKEFLHQCRLSRC